MSERRIQYSARNFDDYNKAILNITRKYYPELSDSYNDSSVGAWLCDIFSDVADSLNYHIDRVYQETSVIAAGERKSLLSIARNNGVKVPGKKAAIVEIELSCELPLNTNGNLSGADESYAPYVKMGTLFSTGMITFELLYDVDFKEQFDENGISNRQIIPNHDSNGQIISYTYKKLGIAVAGQSKIYKRIITESDIKPFMSILIQDTDILGVESIIVKEGTDLSTNPSTYEYQVDEEEFKSNDDKKVNRFFEVNNLIDQYRFGYVVEESTDDVNLSMKGKYNPIWDKETTKYVLDEGGNPVMLDEPIQIRRTMRGQWKRLKNKFTTEYTDNGSLKITFGSGIKNQYGIIPEDAKDFTRYLMSRMEANDYMGVLPEAGTTMYILYRIGGGEQSNIAKDTLTNITNLMMSIEGNCGDADDARKKRSVYDSLSVTNTTPSYGGKDEPSNEELRQLIKYNSGAKNRCVTLHDYVSKIAEMPAKYGTPFRCSAIEENNKVVIYTLGLDSEGHLMSKLSEYVANNIKEYLKMYKMINDFIEIRSGKVINVAFEADIFVDKTYDKSEVVKRVIELITDYMDVRRWMMGDEIFLGDLEKEISKLDGVKNLIELRAYNRVSDDGSDEYSSDEITQELVDISNCCYPEYAESNINNDRRIDLKASNKILFSEANSMFEIKYPNNKDIKVNVKER